jgi:hypothetical protein
MSERRFLPGEVVEVRPAGDILASLGPDGLLDGMPFMPEMLQHVGKRFTVTRRVEKICNNADDDSSAIRRMRSTVHLDDLRCDGSAHGGCQLGCRFYWKEEWLQKAGDAAAPADDGAAARLDELVHANSQSSVGGETVYRCQGTQAVIASEPLGTFDARQFLRELTARNVRAGHMATVLARAFWSKAVRVLRRRPILPLELTTSAKTPPNTREPLNLQPGELVRVRPPEDVRPTLNRHGRNRGLSFSPEMLVYCGSVHRVRGRVERLVDEKTGKMIEISNDCVILEGATCRGEDGCFAYMFCPRGTFPFWREAWLERVNGTGAA